jgi:RimJ/RimL family protein N-acetyltransferase
MQEQREVGYWIDKNYWGKGIATEALKLFLDEIKERPLYAHVAYDNIGSMKVLQKCGFIKIGDGKYFAKARNMEIDEIIFKVE